MTANIEIYREEGFCSRDVGDLKFLAQKASQGSASGKGNALALRVVAQKLRNRLLKHLHALVFALVASPHHTEENGNCVSESVVDDNDTRDKARLSEVNRSPLYPSSAFTSKKYEETDDKLLNQSTLSEDTSSAAISIEDDDWRVIGEKNAGNDSNNNTRTPDDMPDPILVEKCAALLVKLKHFAQTEVKEAAMEAQRVRELGRRSTSGAYTHHAEFSAEEYFAEAESIEWANPSIFPKNRLFGNCHTDLESRARHSFWRHTVGESLHYLCESGIAVLSSARRDAFNNASNEAEECMALIELSNDIDQRLSVAQAEEELMQSCAASSLGSRVQRFRNLLFSPTFTSEALQQHTYGSKSPDLSAKMTPVTVELLEYNFGPHIFNDDEAVVGDAECTLHGDAKQSPRVLLKALPRDETTQRGNLKSGAAAVGASDIENKVAAQKSAPEDSMLAQEEETVLSRVIMMADTLANIGFEGVFGDEVLEALLRFHPTSSLSQPGAFAGGIMSDAASNTASIEQNNGELLSILLDENFDPSTWLRKAEERRIKSLAKLSGSFEGVSEGQDSSFLSSSQYSDDKINNFMSANEVTEFKQTLRTLGSTCKWVCLCSMLVPVDSKRCDTCGTTRTSDRPVQEEPPSDIDAAKAMAKHVKQCIKALREVREINKLLAMNGDHSGCSESEEDVVSPQDMLLWEACLPFDPNYHNAPPGGMQGKWISVGMTPLAPNSRHPEFSHEKKLDSTPAAHLEYALSVHDADMHTRALKAKEDLKVYKVAAESIKHATLSLDKLTKPSVDIDNALSLRAKSDFLSPEKAPRLQCWWSQTHSPAGADFNFMCDPEAMLVSLTPALTKSHDAPSQPNISPHFSANFMSAGEANAADTPQQPHFTNLLQEKVRIGVD